MHRPTASSRQTRLRAEAPNPLAACRAIQLRQKQSLQESYAEPRHAMHAGAPTPLRQAAPQVRTRPPQANGLQPCCVRECTCATRIFPRVTGAACTGNFIGVLLARREILYFSGAQGRRNYADRAGLHATSRLVHIEGLDHHLEPRLSRYRCRLGGCFHGSSPVISLIKAG